MAIITKKILELIRKLLFSAKSYLPLVVSLSNHTSARTLRHAQGERICEFSDKLLSICCVFFITLSANEFVIEKTTSVRRKNRTALQEELVCCIETVLADSREAIRVCAQKISINKSTKDDGVVLELIADIQEELLSAVRDIISHEKKWSNKLKKDFQHIIDSFNNIHEELKCQACSWNKDIKERLVKLVS